MEIPNLAEIGSLGGGVSKIIQRKYYKKTPNTCIQPAASKRGAFFILSSWRVG